jgi:hypothetical protein
MVSDRGGKFGFVYKSRQNVYRKLVGKYGKEGAARIANAGRTKAGRSAMAKKAARTRKRKGK